MTVILGSLTQVSVGGINDGISSINWATQRQPTRLWQLNSWVPYKTQVNKTYTASITMYAGSMGFKVLSASDSCINSTASDHIIVTITPCLSFTAEGIDETMYLTSYSFSKGDPNSFATESWSYQMWVDSDVTGPEFINSGAPNVVLQGISEGSWSGEAGEDAITLDGSGRVTGSTGSVSAGTPGIGNADETEYGIVTRIGVPTNYAHPGGETGQAQAGIPHTPLYLGV